MLIEEVSQSLYYSLCCGSAKEGRRSVCNLSFSASSLNFFCSAFFLSTRLEKFFTDVMLEKTYTCVQNGKDFFFFFFFFFPFFWRSVADTRHALLAHVRLICTNAAAELLVFGTVARTVDRKKKERKKKKKRERDRECRAHGWGWHSSKQAQPQCVP